MKFLFYIVILFNAVCIFAVAAGPAFPEGEILLRHSEGSRVTEFRFVKSTETLRIDQLGESRLPPPINLVDLESGEITLINPVNQTVRRFASEVFDPRETGDDWEMPAVGLGANPTPPGVPAQIGLGFEPTGIPGSAGQSGISSRIGPDPALLPAGVEIPEIPSMSPMEDIPAIPGHDAGVVPPGLAENLPGGRPGGLPGGIPPSVPAGISAGMPAMPGLPGLPGLDGPGVELVAHEETREIHGYLCRRHTLRPVRDLELTLWLSEHPDLPPFHRLIWEEPPRFGPRDPMQEWPGIVRRSGKFPLLVELREAPRPTFLALPVLGNENAADEEEETQRPVMASWEVISLTPGKPDPLLFQIPES